MEQATQPATTTAPARPAEDDRAAFERAVTLACRVAGQVRILPGTAEVTRDVAPSVYGVRLYFGTGLHAGRGVLQVAHLVGAEVTREETRPGTVWIEVRTTLDGIPLVARALADNADAYLLMQEAAAETTVPTGQQIPIVGTDPAAVIAPAMIAACPPVSPNTAVVSGEDGEARCVRCGCTEDFACDGGCYWVPNDDMVDLCSSCATPQQLAAMVFAPVSLAGNR